MNTNIMTQNRDQARSDQRTRQIDRGYVMPPANISATQNEYILEVEMPGVSKDGLEVMVEGNELTIIGRRNRDSGATGELCYCESPQADFRRLFELGPDVDTSRIRAEMKQGVLLLHLPKSERSRPKQIEVQFDAK